MNGSGQGGRAGWKGEGRAAGRGGGERSERALSRNRNPTSPAPFANPSLFPQPQELAAGKEEIFFGFSGKLASAAGEDWDKAFAMINALGKK